MLDAVSGGSTSSSVQLPCSGPFISSEEISEFSASGSGSWEEYVVRRWTTGRMGSNPGAVGSSAEVREEYAFARRMVCLDASLMRESSVGQVLDYLQQERRRVGEGRASFRGSAADVLRDFHEVFEPALLLAIKKAFGLRTDIAAMNESRPIPAVAAFRGNFFDAAIKMWAALPLWKKPSMSAALRELVATEDPAGLQVILGMLKESVLHCKGAQVEIWSRLLLRVAPRALSSSESSVRESGTCSTSASANNARQARRFLWLETLAFVDNWKEKAFATVFVEPTKMYYAAVEDPELKDNVDVHGASVYLAVLLSTLGVRCPRLPFLLDTPVSSVSFLDSLHGHQVKALWHPDNFGKSYEAVPDCREPQARGRVTNHWSNFIFSGRQPWQIANSAVDPATDPERCKKLKPYLDQFAWYFSEEFLVPRLTQHLLERDDTCAALQVVLNELYGYSSSVLFDADAGDPERDVRFWLWDVESFPAVLRKDRAVQLLRCAGLLRRNCNDLDRTIIYEPQIPAG